MIFIAISNLSYGNPEADKLWPQKARQIEHVNTGEKTDLTDAAMKGSPVPQDPEAPLLISDVPPAAGREFVYYYKEVSGGKLVLKAHFPKNWKKSDQRPCIICYHGGGWRAGDMGKVPGQFEDLCDLLASRGMVAVNVQYRGYDQYGGKNAEMCVEDAKSAIRWVRGHAGTLGIDAEKLISCGGSAGGHLSAAVYTTNEFDAASDELSISTKPNLFVWFNPVLNTDGREERFGSPEAARACSPVHHMDQQMPPSLILFGTEDPIMEDGREYIEKARDLGLKAELWIAEGQKHAFFNRPPWKNATLHVVELFLEKHGYLEGPPLREPEAGAEMELFSEVKP